MGLMENSSHSESRLTAPKQNSNRRKWWRRSLIAVVAIATISTVGIGYLYVDAEHGNRLWPKKVTELRGVQLGATRTDVLYKKGPPSGTNGDAIHFYTEDPFFFVVDYSGDKVFRLSLYAEARYSSYPPVAGIKIGNFQSRLVEELGEPDSTSDKTTTTGAVRRTYSYYKLGVNFVLEQERVVGIVVQ